MVTEDYVSFETAKLLKEKGFNEKTYRCYNLCTEEHELSDIDDMAFNNWELDNDGVSAPTLQMAMKWLREVHNIIILLEVERVKYGNVRYNWSIIDDNSDYSVTVRAKYPVYESACDAAIRYCLENLIWL